MGNRKQHFYVATYPPSRVEHQKEEAEKQYYQFMNLARLSINDEIANQKAAEHQINQKIMEVSHLDEEIKRKMNAIKNLERCQRDEVKPSLPINSVPRSGFFHLPGKDDGTMISPDLKRCKKRMIKKGKMDMEYLQQLQELIFCFKKRVGMTSCGTQELNYMVNSMEQRIQHGNNKRADEIKIYQEINNLKETKEVYNAPESAPYIDHWYTREWNSKEDIERKRSIQHSINNLLDQIEQKKMKQIGLKTRVARLKAQLVPVRKKISYLEKEYENVNTKTLEAYKRRYKLGEQKQELAL